MTLFDTAYRLVLRLPPRAFRDAYGDEAIEVARARVCAEPVGAARRRQAVRELVDLARVSVRDRWAARRGSRHRDTLVHRAGPLARATARVAQDVRMAWRHTRRKPWPALLAVATLAVSIAAATTVFSVLMAVVLRPLPFSDPGRLVLIRGWQEGRDIAALSAPEWRDLQAQADGLESVGGMWETNGTLAIGTDVIPAHLAWVTANFFPTLGVDPVFGRHFTAEEDAMGGPRSAIISHDLWQRHFDGSADVLGQTVSLDDQRRTIVGVMPAGFRHYEGNIDPGWSRFDVWIPNADWPNPDMRFLRTVGRVRADVTLEDANRELGAIGDSWPTEADPAAGPRLYARPLGEQLVGDARPAFLLLSAAVGFVLLIGCVNAGGILRTRAVARQREIAVRRAMGASRGRVAQMVLTESLVLALIAGAAGVVLARFALDLLVALGPGSVPRFDEIGLDAGSLGAALAVTIVSAVVCGAAPALQTRAVPIQGALGGGVSTPSPRRWLATSALTVGSVTLAVALLVGAGLMLRTLDAIWRVDTGFARENVLTFRASLSPSALAAQGRATGQRNVLRLGADVYQQFRDRIVGLPGVVAVGAAQLMPFGDGQQSGPFEAAGADGRVVAGSADYRAVLPGYFDAMEARLMAGRMVEDRDVLADTRRVVIDRSLAEQVWPNANAVGRTLRVAVDSNNARLVEAEVIGVVEPLRTHRIREVGLPQVYLPYGQYLDRPMDMHFAVRAETDPASLVPAIRGLFGDLAPGRPMARVRTLDQDVMSAFGDVRFASFALTAFAGIAIVIAITGLYGLLSAVVSDRTREIGFRMALGANRGDVLWLVLRQGVALGLMGLILGLAAAVALTSVLQGLLFGVSPVDGVTFGVVGLLAVVTVIAASAIPAMRAARVDPIAALRAD